MYTHEYSKFPSQIMEKTNFEDVDDSSSYLVNAYKLYISQGNYNAASTLYRQNKDKLSKIIIDATVINRMCEEIRNIQMYALSKGQSVYISQTEPEAAEVGDIWIGGI